MLPREIQSYSYFFLKEEGFKLFCMHCGWLRAMQKKKKIFILFTFWIESLWAILFHPHQHHHDEK